MKEEIKAKITKIIKLVDNQRLKVGEAVERIAKLFDKQRGVK